jgi:hypothetical protein
MHGSTMKITLNAFLLNYNIIKGKGKVTPLQAQCGPEGG